VLDGLSVLCGLCMSFKKGPSKETLSMDYLFYMDYLCYMYSLCYMDDLCYSKRDPQKVLYLCIICIYV